MRSHAVPLCVHVCALVLVVAYKSVHAQEGWAPRERDKNGGGGRLTSCRPGDGAADGTGGGPQEGGREPDR